MTFTESKQWLEAHGYVVSVGSCEVYIDERAKPSSDHLALRKPVCHILKLADEWAVISEPVQPMVMFSTLDAALSEVVRRIEGTSKKVESTSAKKRNWFTLPLMLLAKSTKIVKAVKLFKFTKVLVTASSMALSALIYSLSLGPWFGIGFVLLLFVHEMGHVAVMNRYGHKVSGPVFIPMLGAVIFAPKFGSAEEEAAIGYGGPLAGTVASAVLLGLWAVLPGRHDILLALSYVSAYLNLFNLLPIRPLDGGRITQAIGSWFLWIGLASLGIFSFYLRKPFVLFLWIIVLGDYKKWPAGMRAILGTGCWVTMVALMIFSADTGQDLAVNVFDGFLGAIIVLAMLFEWQKVGEKAKSETSSPTMEPPPQEPPPLAIGVRVRWLALYVALAGVLVGLMAAETRMLPPEMRTAKQKSEKK